MSNLNDLINISNINRLADVESRERGAQIKGDFEGSVSGYWVRLDETGAGIVLYNDKEYKTKRVGFTSIPAGTAVELSFGNGIYYSNW
jgi:hypothetical protein